MPDLDPDSIEYRQAFEERAAEQRRRHEADPLHEPKYLPCNDEMFPSDYTFGSPEEEDA